MVLEPKADATYVKTYEQVLNLGQLTTHESFSCSVKIFNNIQYHSEIA